MDIEMQEFLAGVVLEGKRVFEQVPADSISRHKRMTEKSSDDQSRSYW